MAIVLLAALSAALVDHTSAAEAPRYPKTTQLTEKSETSASFTQKVKNFFQRDKQPAAEQKRFGFQRGENESTTTNRSDSSRQIRRDDQTQLRTTSPQPPKTVPVGSSEMRPRSTFPQSGLDEIPLQHRPFKLDSNAGGPNPLYRVRHHTKPIGDDSIRQVNFQEETIPEEEFPLENTDQEPLAVPPPPMNFNPTRVPLEQIPRAEDVRITNDDDLISLVVRDAPVGTVLSLIAENQGINIITSGEVSTRISVTVNRVNLEDALNAILASTGYTWIRKNGIIIISPIEGGQGGSSQVHGKILRVFNLNFLSAVDVDKTVQGLLSPVGKSFVNEVSSDDNRRTQEAIVVEDLPEYVDRIAAYIAQTDVPPRQVLIEARILEVDLRDELSHGVNLTALAEVAGAEVSFRTQGFANQFASPAFLFGIDGTDLDGLLEALQTTTDTKTLANPKLLVLNGQEARIQIGAQLGFLVTTTTETSTLQNVQFLDVGVVLSVVPRISDDRRVMMTVKPEVSEGQINLITGLPEEETTEVETSVMIGSGEGMVIGGLIKEIDNDVQNKIPILGDMWGIGRLFQRRRAERRRTEIIIVLTPHILPYDHDKFCEHQVQVERVMTPLLEGQLQSVDRPWEVKLPDAIHDPRIIDWERVKDIHDDLKQPYPKPIEYYVPSVQEKYGLQPYSGPVIYPDYPPICDDDSPVNDVPDGRIHPETSPFQTKSGGMKYADSNRPTEPKVKRQIQPAAFEKSSPRHEGGRVTIRRSGTEPSLEFTAPEELFPEQQTPVLYREFELQPLTEELRRD